MTLKKLFLFFLTNMYENKRKKNSEKAKKLTYNKIINVERRRFMVGLVRLNEKTFTMLLN